MAERWISVYENKDGPKLRALAKAAGTSACEVSGMLDSLWIWGLDNVDSDGRIMSADREDIEAVIGYYGRGCRFTPSVFFDACLNTGWIDKINGEYYIHNWSFRQKFYLQYQDKKDYQKNYNREKRKTQKEGQSEVRDEAQDEIQPETRKEGQPAIEKQTEVQDQPKAKEEKTKKPSKKANYPMMFEEIWKKYPRKKDKGQAYKKYCARLNEGTPPELLMHAVERYAEECRRKRTGLEYIKLGKTFFGESLCFTDYLPKEELEGTKIDPRRAKLEQWGV